MSYGLTCGAATSDRVECGSAASLDDLSTWTFLCWVRVTTKTSLRTIMGKIGATGARTLRLDGTAGNIKVQVERTTQAQYITSDTPLATNGAWKCVAATFDVGGAAGEIINIYHGNLSTAMAESTYGTATDASGAILTDADATLVLGNRSPSAVLAFQGDIGPCAHYNRVLSLAECEQWRLRPSANIGSGCVGFWILGNGGSTGTQTDLSGNGNDGTVTGATAASTQLALALHGPLVGPAAAGAARSLLKGMAA